MYTHGAPIIRNLVYLLQNSMCSNYKGILGLGEGMYSVDVPAKIPSLSR